MTLALDDDGRRMVLYAAGFSALWFGLAWINPATTYHLAPFIVPLVPVGMSFSSDRIPAASLRLPSLIAAGLSVATAALLSGLDKLSGPSLLPFGGAAVEALVFSAVALIVALVVWPARQRVGPSQ